MEIYFTKLRPLVKPTVFSPPYPFALPPPPPIWFRSVNFRGCDVRTDGGDYGSHRILHRLSGCSEYIENENFRMDTHILIQAETYYIC